MIMHRNESLIRTLAVWVFRRRFFSMSTDWALSEVERAAAVAAVPRREAAAAVPLTDARATGGRMGSSSSAGSHEERVERFEDGKAAPIKGNVELEAPTEAFGFTTSETRRGTVAGLWLISSPSEGGRSAFGPAARVDPSGESTAPGVGGAQTENAEPPALSAPSLRSCEA